MKSQILSLLLILPLCSMLQNVQAQDTEPKFAVVSERNVMVRMRDGIRLSTDVYRPDSDLKFPVILERSPYSNGSNVGDSERGHFWASRGYIYLYQDVRGRFDSEGGWYAFINEAEDGHDTIEWAARQVWSNGKVGMVGGSYMGFVQWQAASLASPHLKTIVPMFSPLNIYHEMRRGGAFELTRIVWTAQMDRRTAQNFDNDWQSALWHLPLVSLDRLLGHDLPVWRD